MSKRLANVHYNSSSVVVEPHYVAPLVWQTLFGKRSPPNWMRHYLSIDNRLGIPSQIRLASKMKAILSYQIINKPSSP